MDRTKKKHFDDCYFCLVDLKGFNHHKKSSWNYPDLESARRPVSRCEEIPVPKFSALPDMSTEYDEFHEEVAILQVIAVEVCSKVVHQFQSNSSRRS